MPDATEFLVSHYEADAGQQYDEFTTLDEAVVHLRQLVRQGAAAALYQRCPFTTRVDVTVKARRTRKQKTPSAPVAPSDGIPPSGSELPSAGGTKEGAASPQAAESDKRTACVKAEPAEPTASPVSLVTGKEEESSKEGAVCRAAPSPVCVWDCEVDRYGEDGPCAGPIIYDEVTHGRFCEMHMVAAPSGRAEWHRRNGHRNRAVAKVA